MSLKVQLGAVALVSVLSGLVSGLVALWCVGVLGFWLAAAAVAVSLPVGALVVVYFRRRGVSAETIVVGTLLRVFVTVVLAGGLSLVVEEVRSPVFFLSLAVVYLANLGVETWFALESGCVSTGCRTSV